MRIAPLLPVLDPPTLGLTPQRALEVCCAHWPQQVLLRTRAMRAVDERYWLDLFESQYPGLLIANLAYHDPRKPTTLRHYPEGSQIMDAPSPFGMSAHSAAAVQQAHAAGAAWVVLSPLRVTASHPDAKIMEGQEFKLCVAAARNADMQVFGLGGLGPLDLPWALEAGLDGVAGIRSFFS